MNYTWTYLIKAEQAGIDSESIIFKPARVYSAYMEMATSDINQQELITDKPTEINPYYRYNRIFKNLLKPEYDEYNEARELLMDFIIHQAFHTERYMGMSRLGFYKSFIDEDIKNGCFGDRCAGTYNSLGKDRQDIIALQLLNMYRNSSSISIWKEVIKCFYKESDIYQYQDVILLYLGKDKSKQDLKALYMIHKLFLPIEYHVEIYTKKHFGIIGVDETMVLDELELS